MPDQPNLRDMRPGWLRAENEIVDVFGPTLGAFGLAVYMVLAYHAGNDSEAFPSIPTIAAYLRCSDRQVQRELARMLGLGLLARRKRLGTDGRQMSNTYYLLSAKDAAEVHWPSTEPGLRRSVAFAPQPQGRLPVTEGGDYQSPGATGSGDYQSPQQDSDSIKIPTDQDSPPPIVPPQPRISGGGGGDSRPPQQQKPPKGGQSTRRPQLDPPVTVDTPLQDEKLLRLHQVFKQEQFGLWTPGVERMMSALVNEFGEAAVFEMIDDCIANNKRTLAYLRGAAKNRREGKDPAAKFKGSPLTGSRSSSPGRHDKYAGWDDIPPRKRSTKWEGIES